MLEPLSLAAADEVDRLAIYGAVHLRPPPRTSVREPDPAPMMKLELEAVFVGEPLRMGRIGQAFLDERIDAHREGLGRLARVRAHAAVLRRARRRRRNRSSIHARSVVITSPIR